MTTLSFSLFFFFLLFSLRLLKPPHRCKARPWPANPTRLLAAGGVPGLCHRPSSGSSPQELFVFRKAWVCCDPQSCPAPRETHTQLPAPWVLLWPRSPVVPPAGKQDWGWCLDGSPSAFPAKGREKRQTPGASWLPQPHLQILEVRAKAQRS